MISRIPMGQEWHDKMTISKNLVRSTYSVGCVVWIGFDNECPSIGSLWFRWVLGRYWVFLPARVHAQLFEQTVLDRVYEAERLIFFFPVR